MYEIRFNEYLKKCQDLIENSVKFNYSIKEYQDKKTKLNNSYIVIFTNLKNLIKEYQKRIANSKYLKFEKQQTTKQIAKINYIIKTLKKENLQYNNI